LECKSSEKRRLMPCKSVFKFISENIPIIKTNS
jgi:hypothetical protein